MNKLKITPKGLIAVIIVLIVVGLFIAGKYYAPTHTDDSKYTDVTSTATKTSTSGVDTINTTRDAKYRQILEQAHSTINIQFKSEAKEVDILATKLYIEKLQGVVSMEYTSADDALAGFKKRHNDEPEILKKLSELGYNPMGAKITIKIKDSSIRNHTIDSIKTSIYYKNIDSIN